MLHTKEKKKENTLLDKHKLRETAASRSDLRNIKISFLYQIYMIPDRNLDFLTFISGTIKSDSNYIFSYLGLI